MFRILSVLFLLQISLSSFAQSECASNISELRELVGNSDLPLNWLENSKNNQLTFTVKNGGDQLALNLATEKGKWADVTGVICKKGPNYVARVSSLKWGPAAPRMVRFARIRELNLTLPYDSLLVVSVAMLKLEFIPR